MNDSIRRLFELDQAIWDLYRDLPGSIRKEYWVALAQSQLEEIMVSTKEHEDAEWADLFLVALHRLRTQIIDTPWPERVYERLVNHAHKGINHIKEKYGQTA